MNQQVENVCCDCGGRERSGKRASAPFEVTPMPQIFHQSFNAISRVTIFGAVVIAAGLSWFAVVIYSSSYVTESHIAFVQPVPFSHAQPGGVTAYA